MSQLLDLIKEVIKAGDEERRKEYEWRKNHPDPYVRALGRGPWQWSQTARDQLDAAIKEELQRRNIYLSS